MKSKSFMLMILSMGFGLIAAIGISQVMGQKNSNAQPVTKMGPVVVAGDHFDMNTLLSEENVKIENWPANIIPENAITSIDEIKDMAVVTRLGKGMPIVKSTIMNKKEINTLTIPEGFKVVAIKVSAEETFGGILRPGDKVDMIGYFSRRGKGGDKQSTSRTFLKALRVFAVNNKLSSTQNREEGSTNGAIVSVLVTEKQSEDILFVQKTGEIKLVLRGDYAETDDETEGLTDIMTWGNETELTPEPSTGGLFTSLAASKKRANTGSMIIWSGNSPQQVTFLDGELPRQKGQAPSMSGPPMPQPVGPPVVGADGDDFDGSNEIDRGLEQDQYRGE